MDTDNRKGSFPCQSKRILQLLKPGEFPLEYFHFLLNQETRLYNESELTGWGVSGGGGGKELVLSRGWK